MFDNIIKTKNGYRATINGADGFIPNDPASGMYQLLLEAIKAGAEVQEPLAPPPPSEADVRAECARRLAAVVAGYTPEERETWPVQIAEAQAVIGGATTAPMLSALAEARGLPLATFAAAVLQIAAATKQATAKLLAAQARLLAMPEIPADYAADEWWE